jgi:hypothetical protein
LKEEFPTQYFRLIKDETVEIEVTKTHLPFYLQTANIKSASLAFTTDPGKELVINGVEFDDTSIGSPLEDEQLDGLSISLGISGTAPLKHQIKITGASRDTNIWLILELGN